MQFGTLRTAKRLLVASSMCAWVPPRAFKWVRLNDSVASPDGPTRERQQQPRPEKLPDAV